MLIYPLNTIAFVNLTLFFHVNFEFDIVVQFEILLKIINPYRYEKDFKFCFVF